MPKTFLEEVKTVINNVYERAVHCIRVCLVNTIANPVPVEIVKPQTGVTFQTTTHATPGNITTFELPVGTKKFKFWANKTDVIQMRIGDANAFVILNGGCYEEEQIHALGASTTRKVALKSNKVSTVINWVYWT